MKRLSRRLIQVWKRSVSSRITPLISTVGVAGLLLAAGALWVFYEIAEEVWEKETQTFDAQVLLTIQQWHRPWLDQVMIWISVLGQPSVLLVSSLVLAVLLLRRRQAPEAVALAVVAVGGLSLNVLLKNLFARARPTLWERTVNVDLYSFPSGHAMMSMMLYGAIGYLLSAQFPRWRGGIAAVTVILVGAIGFSRLYLGVHWLTDVVAGYAAGLVWLLVVWAGLEIWKQRRVAKPRNGTGSSAGT